MANMKEIQLRIKSIKDIMKITNAMYLISTSKLKKARKSLEATVPYFTKLQSTIHDILILAPDMQQIFFDQREDVATDDRKRGYVVFTADKGMAGAYNHNVIRKAEEEMAKGKNNRLFVVGQVGRRYFIRKGANVDEKFLYTSQNPVMYRARNISEDIIELFEKGELDEVYVIYTEMITSMKSEVKTIQVLPLERKKFDDITVGENHYNQASFLPSPESVMDHIIPNYIKGLIFGVLVESFSSEQNARMTAMDAATTSARDMLKDLDLLYNRARQAAITQEITEIVSGANGLKK
jgi:F-type H+-transporting ATPase subunit gamma